MWAQFDQMFVAESCPSPWRHYAFTEPWSPNKKRMKYPRFVTGVVVALLKQFFFLQTAKFELLRGNGGSSLVFASIYEGDENMIKIGTAFILSCPFSKCYRYSSY